MNQSSNSVCVNISSGKSLCSVGSGCDLVLIAGPCVIESRDHIMRHAEKIISLARNNKFSIIFKASFDKANRTSLSSFRGPGIDAGLKILEEVKNSFHVPVLTDIHSEDDARTAGAVVDVVQIPAFLCRQTSLLAAAAQTGKVVLIKKGQFLAPQDMQFAAAKVVESGNDKVLLCERGSCFGYRDLVVDFRSLLIMRALGFPVVFDATHSVQVMGGGAGTSGGDRRYVPMLARAAVAIGIDALFLECHESPDTAPSDGPNMIPLAELGVLLSDLRALQDVALQTRHR